MKNHWIKKKEDREDMEYYTNKYPEVFRGKFQEADTINSGGRMYSQRVSGWVRAESHSIRMIPSKIWDKAVEDLNAALDESESLKKDEWNHVAIVFDGTVSEIHVNGRALEWFEVDKLYEQRTTCKCGKSFKTNVGHTEKCLKDLGKSPKPEKMPPTYDQNGYYS